ncbi:amidohydrolase [Nannocystaceae bacterium ST9]
MSASRRRFVQGMAGLSLFGLGCRPRSRSSGHADTLILGRIHTLTPGINPDALAIREGVIQAIGRADELAELRGPATRVIELGEGAALPGLTDAHAHLIGLGQSREVVDLRGAASLAEVVQRLRDAAPREGWIVGRGWDQNLWGGAMPTRAVLDEAFGERPVWLRRVDGHAGWANGPTLELAGIDAGSVAPEGGEILRDERGQPTGVLIDAAMDRIPEPTPSEADVARWADAATREAARNGLVGVHEMGMDAAAADAFARLETLPIRVFGYAGEAWWKAGMPGWNPSAATGRFTIEGVKIYVDGALGSRGAALIEPYADRPDHRGLLLHEREYFVELVTDLLERGMQPAAHAIGDLANQTILAAYAEADARVPERGDRRMRIEHAQILDLADIPRMAELGVIASMQPTHATSDMPWVPDRIGSSRLAGAYAWRRLLDAGVPLAFGSDFPVEQVSPLLGLHAAVTRQDRAGQPEGGWLPDQRLSLAEAIAAFSSGAAWAVSRERELGRLEVGYAADLTLLDRDPFAVDPSELLELGVRATIVAGQVVFEG